MVDSRGIERVAVIQPSNKVRSVTPQRKRRGEGHDDRRGRTEERETPSQGEIEHGDQSIAHIDDYA